MLGLLLALVCLVVPASGAVAQSADAGTPSAPLAEQSTAEQTARAPQLSPVPGPVTIPAPTASDSGSGHDGTSTGGGGGCVLGICDAASWLQDQVGSIVANFLKDLTSGISSAVATFFESLNFITRTPRELSYQEDYVVRFESAMRAMSYGLLALVGMVTGFNLLWRPALGMPVPGATQILPRLILGAILITTAHDWTRLAIDVNNAACDLVVGETLPQSLTELAWSSMEPMMLLAFLVRAVLLVLLVLQLLMRLALVDILLVLAPLAAVLWILPQTQGWASLWAQRFVSTVFAQFVQMLALSLGLDLLTKLSTNSTAALIQPLLGIAVLAVGLKIPGLMGGALAGGSVVGTVAGAATGAAVGRAPGPWPGWPCVADVQRQEPLRRPDRPASARPSLA
jgi:Conjugal transfer protein TrbL